MKVYKNDLFIVKFIKGFIISFMQYDLIHKILLITVLLFSFVVVPLLANWSAKHKVKKSMKKMQEEDEYYINKLNNRR